LTAEPAGKTRESAVERLLGEARSSAARCYQCGKCSAGCPMGAEMSLQPHDIMRLVAKGHGEQACTADSLWLCLTCETCSTRCPTGADPAAVIDMLREVAVRTGVADLPRAIGAFHRSFLDQVRGTGRLYEAGFILQYKLRSGALLQDAGNAPAMVRRGKLHALPARMQGVDEVRAIFARCGVKPRDLRPRAQGRRADEGQGG
jgi:heterodisulfide reductase subunit C